MLQDKLKGNQNSSILVIGCFHGDEPQGKYLIEEYLKTKPDTNLCFIPCLNEYGLEHNVRTNSNGVDLNRNFPTKNWIKAENNDYFGGDYPNSEVETKFLVDLIEKNKFDAIITIHSPYKTVNYDGPAEALANKISEIVGYPTSSDIGYPTPGSFGTYCGVERQIPTITIEIDENEDIEILNKKFHKLFQYLENEY